MRCVLTAGIAKAPCINTTGHKVRNLLEGFVGQLPLQAIQVILGGLFGGFLTALSRPVGLARILLPIQKLACSILHGRAGA